MNLKIFYQSLVVNFQQKFMGSLKVFEGPWLHRPKPMHGTNAKLGFKNGDKILRRVTMIS
jgi:hypothetical protein